MKTKTHSIIVCISLILLVFPSCKKDATVDPPISDPQLVVTSFISPSDDTISVSVKMSAPLFSATKVDPYSQVTNATVKISDGSFSVTVPYSSKFKKYVIGTSALPILPGKTYYLEVFTSEGISVNAETTVPVNLPKDLTVEVNKDSKIATFKWTDIPNETNYYRLNVFGHFKTNGNFEEFRIVTNMGWSGSSSVKYLYTDKSSDGEGLIQNIELSSDYFNPNYSMRQLEAAVISINYDYYAHHKSIYSYNGGNDYFSEPTLFYSNIKGGLGTFGAYLISNLVIKPY